MPLLVQGRTPLIAAACGNGYETDVKEIRRVVEVLLSRGADPNAVDIYVSTSSLASTASIFRISMQQKHALYCGRRRHTDCLVES